MGLTRKINNLRVTSIRDLDIKVKFIVEEITDFAVFENNESLVNILSSLLIQRIKELAAGPMAVSPLTTVQTVRNEIAKYMGLNFGNLNQKLLIRKNIDNNNPSNNTEQNNGNQQQTVTRNNYRDNNRQRSQDTRQTNNGQQNQNRNQNYNNQQQNQGYFINYQQPRNPSINQINRNQSQNIRSYNPPQAMSVDNLTEENNEGTEEEDTQAFFTQ